MYSQDELRNLLDTSKPFDESKVRLLEILVNEMLDGSSSRRVVAHEVLSQLKANSEAWRVVGAILQLSRDLHTRFFALSILENCIATRWNVLPEEQKAGVKEYITKMAVDAASDTSLSNEKFFVTKVNETLIQIVKHEWPHNWPTFISDLCAAARTSQALCENSMKILNLLSEEVFDFGQDQMTSKKVTELMTSLNSQFQEIYDLCIFVLQNSVQPNSTVNVSLITATLQCLSHFVKWIPYAFLFETNLIDILIQYFWEPTQYRVACVRCLTEIALLRDLSLERLQKLYKSLWCPLVQRVSQLSDSTMDYNTKGHAHSRLFWETFYCQLALCLTAFLKNHHDDVCAEVADQNDENMTLFVLNFLVKMTSRVPHEETFKILMDFWHHFSGALVFQSRVSENEKKESAAPLMLDDMTSDGNATSSTSGTNSPSRQSVKRLQIYQPMLNDLRFAIVQKMARPQEVCIHYDEETGTVDRDYEVDTDEVTLYNLMRETLVFMTNLGEDEMQKVLLQLLQALTEDAKNPNQKNWNPTILSRLCWAIGSISGAMSAERERSFLVLFIRELLWLCEHKRGKENKAIVASMIMYVFGQYPRFLKSFVRFLETVVIKLFEFMKETFSGVQDMACETFLKISKKCAAAMCSIDPSKAAQTTSLADKIFPQIHAHYQALQASKQQLMLMESVGHIIAAQNDVVKVEQTIIHVLTPFTAEWQRILLTLISPDGAAAAFELNTARKLTEIVRVNERIASTCGAAYSRHLQTFLDELFKLYATYSSQISTQVATAGPGVMVHTQMKALRNFKRASLLLLKTHVGSTVSLAEANLTDVQTLKALQSTMVQLLIPPVSQYILQDYLSCAPQVRDYEVLSLLTVLVSNFKDAVQKDLPLFFHCVFDPTLDMIKADFHSFPDHRQNFYEFLKACNDYCLEGIFSLPDLQRRYFIESLIWAFKHEQPAVAEQGLCITLSFLKNVFPLNPQILMSFWRTFYMMLLTEIVSVMTDTLHKSGFKYQAAILMFLIHVVEMRTVDDVSAQLTKPDVMNCLVAMLLRGFPNLNSKQVETFVLGLFNTSGDAKAFNQHLRDFLIQLKEFAGGDELFEEERQAALKVAKEAEEKRRSMIPGMIPQYTVADAIAIQDFE